MFLTVQFPGQGGSFFSDPAGQDDRLSQDFCILDVHGLLQSYMCPYLQGGVWRAEQAPQEEPKVSPDPQGYFLLKVSISNSFCSSHICLIS